MSRNKNNKWACQVYEDQFKRLNKTFDDEALGRILRAAFNYGFYDEITALDNPIEEYAAGELKDAFIRNRETFDKQTTDGKINAAIRYAKNEEDLIDRLQSIDNITNYQISDARSRWKSKKER